MHIATERLLLRRPRLDDLEPMFEIMSNPSAMRYWSTLPHASRDVTRPWLEQMIARTRAGGEDFLIEHQDRVIGTVGAGRLPDFGFIIHPDFWGRGFATEASRAFIDYAFRKPQRPNCGPMSTLATPPRSRFLLASALSRPAAPNGPSCSATNGATVFTLAWPIRMGSPPRDRILSLSKARKAKARAESEATAEANRLKFGRTKAEKTTATAEKARKDKVIDAHKRERKTRLYRATCRPDDLVTQGF